MGSDIDGKYCCGVLLDRSADERDRVGAAEALMYFVDPSACDALWQVLVDESEDDNIREEAAGSRGSLWLQLGVDYSRLAKIPARFLNDALDDVLMSPDLLDETRLDPRTAEFVRARRTSLS